ncbi:MAG: NADH-quinone oxidoreductase subunit C [Sulfurimonas sp.]|jgi:NADH-quinone oxidoreductase subunit C|uniref:NADH-quinone oxidoreductase subunit C n=1 Tax=Sulfurimonas sp. TaxID=2022749 RepID=UPI0039E50EA0
MLNTIKSNFATDDIIVKRNDLYKVSVVHERVFELIHFIGNNYNYKILNAITCTDWIEDGHFALTYIITTLDRKNTFMVQTMINREEAHINSLSKEFAQAQIFERDLHEMYGINFIGNENLKELSLENWVHTPPLRREFDTLEFVNNHLTFREGREDNMDAKAETKRIRAEKKALKAAGKKAEEEAKENAEAETSKEESQEENTDGK